MLSKQCNKCGEVKPLINFHKGSGKMGHIARCKPCRSVDRKEDYQRNPRRQHVKRVMHHRYNQALHKYGLNRSMYQALLRAYESCAICGESFDTVGCVDHCHETGAIRGMLCKGCNTGLGMFKDNAERLENAKKYLLQEA